MRPTQIKKYQFTITKEINFAMFTKIRLRGG